MVVRSPALLSLGLAAFLRSLLPAQPAPCPHGAGARAAFRKPSCIFPAPRLRGGPLGRAWASGPHPAVPGRSSERLPSLRRLLGGSPSRSSRSHRGREMSAAGVRVHQSRLAQGSRWVGGRRALLSDLTPTLAPPMQSSGRTPGLDSRTNFPAKKGREGLRAGGWDRAVQTLPRHQPGRSGDPEALPRAAASRRRASAPPASTQGGLAL